MKVGIICAGDEELAPFLPLIENCKITEKSMLKFHEGKINECCSCKEKNKNSCCL